MYSSSGYLIYEIDNSGHKLNVIVDRDLSNYYRALIPKYIDVQPQKYPPHISVVRKETPIHLDKWNCYNGEEVEFFYDGIIRFGQVYCWLNVFCVRLEEIRLELGLPVSSIYTKPPEGFIKCFHMTLGNFKKFGCS